MRLDLRNRLNEQFNEDILIMVGREKGILGETTVAIDDWDYLEPAGEERYVVFTVKENDSEFFFGGAKLTQICSAIDTDYSKTEIKEIQEEGLEVKFEKIKTKKGRDFTKVTLFP